MGNSVSNGQVAMINGFVEPPEYQHSVEKEQRFAKDVLSCVSNLIGGGNLEELKSRMKSEIEASLEATLSPEVIDDVCTRCAQQWKLRGQDSEEAFNGLILILEHGLSDNLENQYGFQKFIDNLGYHTVLFWKKAVPRIYDTDIETHSRYRDALLFCLAVYDVNTGKNRLRELFAAVPGLRDSLLGRSAKRFEEAFHSMLTRRSGAGSPMSLSMCQSDRLSHRSSGEEDTEMVIVDVSSSGSSEHGQSDVLSPPNTMASESDEANRPGTPDCVASPGLSSQHFNERVINVSNAPPVSLQKRKNSWTLGPGSGGLVSCCAPVLTQDPQNVWLACFGPQSPYSSDTVKDIIARPSTNTFGLPRTPITEKLYNNVDENDDVDSERAAKLDEELSLYSLLKDYSKDNFQLNPVAVSCDDYKTYYGGISNGLLWPALHSLSEYILPEYDDPAVLKEHWHSYIRVNYMFALNAVRKSRPQDFLWIHDYHLMLTGLIIQSLDTNLEVGFFLHIPFQPPEEMFTKYGNIGEAILRGLLRFTKVGFQTHRDRATFLKLVIRYLPEASIKNNFAKDTVIVTHQGFSASIGVFPVSIKNEEFLDLVNAPEVQNSAMEVRKQHLGACTGKFLFSVERFDYTKGIKEKLLAYKRYYELFPDRIGKDVFLQVAVVNRRDVATYQNYQDECLAAAELINATIRCPENPDWRPLIFVTDGLNRPMLVAHYMAMDVGIVTPKRDGMNLVAKEMVLCNPHATLILSDGAGTEQQFFTAGFYKQEDRLYHRVTNLCDANGFAKTIYEAVVEDKAAVINNASRLREFVMANDIEKWSSSFLDHGWAYDVIQPNLLVTLDDFYSIMHQTRTVRRKMVASILEGSPLRSQCALSLKNAKDSLEMSLQLKPNANLLLLKVSPTSSSATALIDVSDEIKELDLDLSFLKLIVNNDESDDITAFTNELARYHPVSCERFQDELTEIIRRIPLTDHFNFFLAPRDGVLKSFAGSFISAVQPCYSAVIQAIFAHRCTQYAAIITSAPLINIGIIDVTVMPDSYYCYGASNGRNWYIDASKKFKDMSMKDNELGFLDTVHARIRELTQLQQYNQFGYIGSGIQKHYGSVTVARQDMAHTIDKADSEEWRDKIFAIVKELDPNELMLHCEDSDLDIKITLRTGITGKQFTKGDGLNLFISEMGLDLSEGKILICGCSETDLTLLEQALANNPQNTYTIWVTSKESLCNEVARLCKEYENENYAIVSCPEVITGSMAQSSIRAIKIRMPENEL